MHEKGISRMGIVVDLLFCIATLMWANQSTGLVREVALGTALLCYIVAGCGWLAAAVFGSKP